VFLSFCWRYDPVAGRILHFRRPPLDKLIATKILGDNPPIIQGDVDRLLAGAKKEHDRLNGESRNRVYAALLPVRKKRQKGQEWRTTPNPLSRCDMMHTPFMIVMFSRVLRAKIVSIDSDRLVAVLVN
jgi:hypothetical protein